MKKRKYTLGQRCWHIIEQIMLSLLSSICSLLPISLLRGLSLVLGAFLSSVPWGYPRRVKQNLELAFGLGDSGFGVGGSDLKPETRNPNPKIRALSRSAWQNVVLVGLELLHYSRRPLEELRRDIEIEGRENLEQAANLGKGVVALSAHLGAFILLAMRLDLEGYQGGYPTRLPKDPVISGFILDFNRRFRIDIISDYPRWKLVKDCWRCLEQNRVLFMLNDLHANDGVIVPFFGRPAATPAGALQMSKRLGSPLVPMYIVRQPKGKHKVVILPPFKPEDTGDEERDLWVNTARLTKMVEDWIRQYPQQWWWVHDRWKVRPKDIRKWKKMLEERGLDKEPALRFW